MEICAPMETDAAEGDHMETEDEGSGRSKSMDRDGHGGDSDSGSDMACWSKSQFWYEVRGLRDIPDYRTLPYPWEEKKEEEEEEGCSCFLVIVDHSCSDSAEELRKRRRLDAQPATGTSDSADSTVDAASPTPEEVLDVSSLCTSAEVVDVRMKMHECFENGVSHRSLFKSEANKEELRCLDNDDKEPYIFYVNRCQHESVVPSKYAHVFPKISGGNPQVSYEWVKPSTLEGDREFVNFFSALRQHTKYGDTKDHVMAKAIVLANKLSRKMLYFQIDIAVKDIMVLKEDEEMMQQRYSLYYFAASEIVLNGKDFKSVLKSIRDGDSGLPYDLTEFDSCNPDFWDGIIADIINCLVTRLRAEREQGRHNEWLFDRLDDQVADIVCETVNQQLGFDRHLYVDFLAEKMKIANDNGLLAEKMKIAEDHGLLLSKDTNLELLEGPGIR